GGSDGRGGGAGPPPRRPCLVDPVPGRPARLPAPARGRRGAIRRRNPRRSRARRLRERSVRAHLPGHAGPLGSLLRGGSARRAVDRAVHGRRVARWAVLTAAPVTRRLLLGPSPMTDLHFSGLVIVAAGASAAPPLLGPAPAPRLPAVVLEIVAGIAIGPSGLGWVSIDEPIEVLSLVGLAFLLFLAGLEIDFERLRGRLVGIAGLGFV